MLRVGLTMARTAVRRVVPVRTSASAAAGAPEVMAKFPVGVSVMHWGLFANKRFSLVRVPARPCTDARSHALEHTSQQRDVKNEGAARSFPHGPSLLSLAGMAAGIISAVGLVKMAQWTEDKQLKVF